LVSAGAPVIDVHAGRFTRNDGYRIVAAREWHIREAANRGLTLLGTPGSGMPDQAARDYRRTATIHEGVTR
jgi:hypothetical protein